MNGPRQSLTLQEVLDETEDAALSKKLFGVTSGAYSSDEEIDSGDDSDVVQVVILTHSNNTCLIANHVS